MVKYELKKGDILKDGHTMFLQDVVKDLNRGAFLESELKIKTVPNNPDCDCEKVDGHCCNMLCNNFYPQ